MGGKRHETGRLFGYGFSDNDEMDRIVTNK